MTMNRCFGDNKPGQDFYAEYHDTEWGMPGMTFVGSTIMYAFMQAVGMVNDHMVACWRYGK